jgi:Ca2+-binding EF-hand superfamily protein
MKTVALLTALALVSAASLVMAEPGGSHGGKGGFERLRAADTNGDGLISRAEAAALPRLAERFDAIDANRDGQLSRDELRAFHQSQRLQRMGDKDGDGKISKAEALAKATERFDRVDANHDGFITQDELQAARAAHKHRRG